MTSSPHIMLTSNACVPLSVFVLSEWTAASSRHMYRLTESFTVEQWHDQQFHPATTHVVVLSAARMSSPSFFVLMARYVALVIVQSVLMTMSGYMGSLLVLF